MHQWHCNNPKGSKTVIHHVKIAIVLKNDSVAESVGIMKLLIEAALSESKVFVVQIYAMQPAGAILMELLEFLFS